MHRAGLLIPGVVRPEHGNRDLVGQLCHECCVHSGDRSSLLREVVGQAIVATGDTHSHRGDPPVFSGRPREPKFRSVRARTRLKAFGGPAAQHGAPRTDRRARARRRPGRGLRRAWQVRRAGRAGRDRETAVLAAVRESAAARGMRVLRARGTELEREFAFGVVRQALRAAVGARIRARAGRAAARDRWHGGGHPRTAGRRPGSRRPCIAPPGRLVCSPPWPLLAVRQSRGGRSRLPGRLRRPLGRWPIASLSAFLLTRLEELDVALVLATRPQEARTSAPSCSRRWRASGADLIRLSPLSRAAVAELVESTLVGVPDPLFVDTCLRETGGSPFLLRVLVDALREGGVAPTADATRYVERIGARPVGRSVRQAPPVAGAGRTARAGAGDPRGERASPDRAAGRSGRGRGGRGGRVAGLGWDHRVGPAVGVDHPIVRSGLDQTSPAPSAHEVTAARHDCSPRSRARASASPSTWS